MNPITIKNSQSGPGQGTIQLTSFRFPGGEVHCQIPIDFMVKGAVIVVVQLTSSDDIVQLLLVTDALRRKQNHDCKYILELGYVPYARQDRVCNPGEPLSISVFASLINSLNYDTVCIADPHSDVTPALINNCKVVSQTDVLRNSTLAPSLNASAYLLVAPNAGAVKKVYQTAKTFGGLKVIQADKVRDTTTGEITETIVHCDNIHGRNVLILDDICDGGRTFVELAKKLKENNAGRIELFVTHGIFSKGLDVFNGLIDHVYTTSSLPQKNHRLLTVL